MSPSTPGEVLIPGAIAIVFVVAWFVFGVIDGTRGDRPHHHGDRVPQPVRHPRRDTAHDSAHGSALGGRTTRRR
jgi:hypothetical protein